MIDEVCHGLEILKRRVFLCRQSMPTGFPVKVNRRKLASLFSLLDSKINERSLSGSAGPRNRHLLPPYGRHGELFDPREF